MERRIQDLVFIRERKPLLTRKPSWEVQQPVIHPSQTQVLKHTYIQTNQFPALTTGESSSEESNSHHPSEGQLPNKRQRYAEEMYILQSKKKTHERGGLICSTRLSPKPASNRKRSEGQKIPSINQSSNLPHQPNKQRLRRNLQRPQPNLPHPTTRTVRIGNIPRERLVSLLTQIVQQP
jgi:hypothetical protein